MKTRRVAPVEQTSADILTEQIERLKDLFPEAVTEGKVDFEKLKKTLGEIVDDRPERYSFTWAGKRDAIRLLQVPSRATLKPCPEESVDWETTKNLFIEGENLEVLKLLYKSYAGRVKMIYIDPPYNTGNDFIYPDNFADPLNTYLKLTGQKDAEGNLLTSNPETSGRYHSAWLSMMYPRLFVARRLLHDKGVIFVSIDDTEVANFRLLMNEVFGEDAFIAQFIWKSRQNKDNRNITRASIDHEYVLCYGKRVRGSERTAEYSNPDNDPRGPWTSANMVGILPEDQRPNCHYDLIDPKTSIKYGKPPLGWRYDKNTMDRLIKEKKILWPSSPDGRPRRKLFSSELKNEFTGYSSIIGEDIYTRHGTQEINELFGARIMDFPKPSAMIRELTEQGCDDEEGIVLDFFAGSCPTAQAVMELNRADAGKRKYIMVQLPEPTNESSISRKVGFHTIAEIGKDRVRRAIKKLKEENDSKLKFENTSEDLGFRVFKLDESNYRQWRGVEEKDVEKYADEMDLFTDPLLSGWKPEDVVWEVALKEGYGLSSTVEEVKGVKGNHVWQVADPDRDQSFHVCLDNDLKAATVKALKLGRDDLFVCRDAALTDEQAANLALQCKLKTI